MRIWLKIISRQVQRSILFQVILLIKDKGFMKSTTLFSLIFFLVTPFTQSQTFGISGEIYICDTSEQEYHPRTFWICKNKKCDVVEIEDSTFLINNLSAGEYVIKFKNIWNQTITDTIEINQSISDYTICLDRFQERDSYPLLELFEKSQKIKIQQTSIGCFHRNETELTFEKSGQHVLVKITSEEKTKSIRIYSPDLLEKITDFFKKIDLMAEGGGCTTTDYYEFSFDNINVEIQDSNCSWYGFQELIEDLF